MNDSVYKDERLSQVFVTLSLLLINKRGSLAKYSGAGDLPLLFKSGNVKSVQSEGLLLGFSDEAKYEDHIFKSEEMNRKNAEDLVKTLKERFNIDANIVGCAE